MSIDIDIDTFPHDNLIETLEFFKERNIECNIIGAKRLIEDERINEVQYLLDEKCITINDFISAYDFDDDPQEIKFLIKIKLTRVSAGETLIEIIEENNLRYLRAMMLSFEELQHVINYNYGEPLLTACKLGNINIVRFLVDAGADFNVCAYDPIIDSLLNDDVELTEYLLLNGSDLRNLKSKTIEDIFTENCVNSINFIIDKLENRHLEHLRNMDWLYCLQETVKNGNTEILIKLAQNGVNVTSNYYELKSFAKHNKMMRFYLRILRRASRRSCGNLALDL
jgi:DNA polymerase I-like protein with 3'-5' exonuclease and polymerase domains